VFRDGEKAIMVTQILCAIDDEEYSETAAEFAIDLARQLSARLVFQMVNPAVLPGPRGAPVYLWADDYIRGYLDEAFRRARQSGVSLVICETGRVTSIAESIVACADFHEADLIVIGARSRRRIADLFRRSVSRAVADTANCPVLIIRQVRNRYPGRDSLPYREAA
jgi:nucleotide-binding universal stress UspA family protein